MVKPKSNELVTYVLDMLAPLGRVQSRPMFGGHNVSLDGLTFGLIIGDVLFLKTDGENRATFVSAGLEPFTYSKKDGKVMVTSYHTAPDCLDDWDALGPWARGALAAAKRAKSSKPATKRPKAAAKKLAKSATSKAPSKTQRPPKAR
jgi:DNA transformation protein and related proteins